MAGKTEKSSNRSVERGVCDSGNRTKQQNDEGEIMITYPVKRRNKILYTGTDLDGLPNNQSTSTRIRTLP
jgi:hypothetical protein